MTIILQKTIVNVKTKLIKMHVDKIVFRFFFFCKLIKLFLIIVNFFGKRILKIKKIKKK